MTKNLIWGTISARLAQNWAPPQIFFVSFTSTIFYKLFQAINASNLKKKKKKLKKNN